MATIEDTALKPLHSSIEEIINHYFNQIADTNAVNIYDLVIQQTEEPLLRSVMKYTKNNQSKAAILLGISRGTLRKKLKQYNLDAA